MKNNLYYKIFFLFSLIILNLNVNADEKFNFDITEIEILENGNIYKGLKRGKVTTDSGIIIDSDNFEYNKLTNILNAKGNVVVEDTVQNYKIFADNITYFKNEEKIFTKGNSKAIDNNGQIIIADNFEYNKLSNIFIAKENVIIEDTLQDYKIFADDITYFKNEEKIFSRGNISANIESKYNIKTRDAIFLRNEQKLSSQNKTIIRDTNNQTYHLDKFVYFLNTTELRGENVLIITNEGLPKSDKFYFSSAIINLKKKEFLAKDTTIKIHKDVFDESENDPRIKGVSSKGEENITKIKKGIFTSCKEKDGCPPWSVSAAEITHDKTKRQLTYDNAVLKVYNLPIFYFPKFFHPDPTVKRQSGLLQPQLNDSNILGSSITIPYFGVISENKDYTLVSTLFDKNTKMLQNEFRYIDKNTSLLLDMGIVRDFKSTTGKKKNINHLFSKYNVDLDLENFDNSKLEFTVERTTNDTYLKSFDQYLLLNSVKPKNSNTLNNQVKLTLDHQDYNFTSEIGAYESLDKSSSDRYQYIIPSYSFNKSLTSNFLDGSINFNSSGDNNLNNTNVLKSNIINKISYQGNDNISKLGFKNNFNIETMNLNSLGKNSSEYKSSPQIELMNIFEFKSYLPLIKEDDRFINYLTPKASLRLNTSDMKNYSGLDRTINTNNIFNINRLGLNDSFESGKSLSLGIDYKKENLENNNKYLEFQLATVLRDKEEKFIPTKSTLNRKQSNLFGSISNNFSENLNIEYNFAIDNDLNTFQQNNLNTKISVNNLVTSFDFVEYNEEMGDENYVTFTTTYNFDDAHNLNFNTRRNRKINLTEYYDLVYEYKNDCLVAAVKYKKTYYKDRDVKPEENLMFTITLFPLTSFEQKADNLLN